MHASVAISSATHRWDFIDYNNHRHHHNHNKIIVCVGIMFPHPKALIVFMHETEILELIIGFMEEAMSKLVWLS